MEQIFIAKQTLPELLEELTDIKGIEWIRLHYAYPADFPLKITGADGSKKANLQLY